MLQGIRHCHTKPGKNQRYTQGEYYYFQLYAETGWNFEAFPLDTFIAVDHLIVPILFVPFDQWQKQSYESNLDSSNMTQKTSFENIT